MYAVSGTVRYETKSGLALPNLGLDRATYDFATMDAWYDGV